MSKAGGGWIPPPPLFFCRFAFFGSIRTTFSRDIFHFDPYFMSKSVLVIKKYLRLLCTNLRVCFYRRGTKNTQKWFFFKNNVKFEFPMVILVGIDTPHAKIKKIKISKIQKGVPKIPKNYFFPKIMSNLNSPWSF